MFNPPFQWIDCRYLRINGTKLGDGSHKDAIAAKREEGRGTLGPPWHDEGQLASGITTEQQRQVVRGMNVTTGRIQDHVETGGIHRVAFAKLVEHVVHGVRIKFIKEQREARSS